MRITINADEYRAPGGNVVFCNLSVDVEATPMFKPLADKAAEITTDFLAQYENRTMDGPSVKKAVNESNL